MAEIYELYNSGLSGWLGEEEAKSAWAVLKNSSGFFEGLPIATSPFLGRKAMLYEVCRKVLGRDTKNYGQEIGDCVSFGAKNAIEYLMCCEILLGGEREMFKEIFPPYLYGTGRVFIGGGRLGNSDGSLGSWQADAVTKFGTISTDTEGCPSYAGSVAKEWGRRPGPPDKFVTVGKQHPVKSAALIRSWDELVTAIVNGYPCTVASDQGFEMEAGSDGFHDARGSWAHQMCIIGVDDEHPQPYAIILNSWGDVHGRLKDFKTGEDLPVGVIRAKKSTVERMIRQNETFAFSSIEGWAERDIPRELFKLI